MTGYGDLTAVPCAVLCMAIATSCMGLRFYSLGVSLNSWKWEEALLLMAWIFGLVTMSTTISLHINGLGKHVSNDIYLNTFLKVLWLNSLSYTLSVTFAKITILSMYLRLMTFQAPRFLSNLFLGFLILSHLWIVISIFTSCIPLKYLWSFNSMSSEGVYCHPEGIFWLNMGFDVGINVLIFTLPIPMLFYVVVPPIQHFVLGLMVFFGYLICAVTGLRAHAWMSRLDTHDFTYTASAYLNFTILTISLLIIWHSLFSLRYIYTPLRDTQAHENEELAFGFPETYPYPVISATPGTNDIFLSGLNHPGNHKIPQQLKEIPIALNKPIPSQQTTSWGSNIMTLNTLPTDSSTAHLTENPENLTYNDAASDTPTHRTSTASHFLPIFAPLDPDDDCSEVDGRRLSYKILDVSSRSPTPSSLRFAMPAKPRQAKKRPVSLIDDDEWLPHPGDRGGLLSPMYAPSNQWWGRD